MLSYGSKHFSLSGSGEEGTEKKDYTQNELNKMSENIEACFISGNGHSGVMCQTKNNIQRKLGYSCYIVKLKKTVYTTK